LSASSAVAGAVSVTGTLNETLEGSNNYFLSDTPAGTTYRSLSQLTLNALAATPTTRYQLNSDVSYFKYFGPGASETGLSWGTPLAERFSILHDTYYGKYNFALSWARSDVETTALQQTGFRPSSTNTTAGGGTATDTGRGSVDNYDIDVGYQRELSHLDSISWSAHASTVSYSDPTSTPYVDVSSNVSWRRRLTPLTNVSYSLYFDWFSSDDGTERQNWKPTVSIDSQLTKRLTFFAATGLTYIDVTQNQTQPSLVSPAPTGFPFNSTNQQTGTFVGWDVNAVLTYRLLQNTQATLTVSHATTPTLFGDLQQIESIAASLNHTINSLSSISFYAQYSRTQAGAPETFSSSPSSSSSSSSNQSQFFSASANYAYALTREWRSNVSYTFRERHDSAGSASSNTVLVALVHNFTLYGKPPEAVVKTPSELAQESIARAQQVFPFLAPR
jgi:hypothetical protein